MARITRSQALRLQRSLPVRRRGTEVRPKVAGPRSAPQEDHPHPGTVTGLDGDLERLFATAPAPRASTSAEMSEPPPSEGLPEVPPEPVQPRTSAGNRSSNPRGNRKPSGKTAHSDTPDAPVTGTSRLPVWALGIGLGSLLLLAAYVRVSVTRAGREAQPPVSRSSESAEPARERLSTSAPAGLEQKTQAAPPETTQPANLSRPAAAAAPAAAPGNTGEGAAREPLSDDALREAIAKLAGSPAWAERVRAAHALANATQTAATDALARALADDGDWAVRAAAADALAAQVPSTATRSALDAASRGDAEPAVREAARLTLEQTR